MYNSINDYCEVLHNHDDYEDEKYPIFAIGDIVALDGPDWRAKQGHVAEVMARNVAFNNREMDKGSDKRRGYLSHVNILCVMDSEDGAALVYGDNKHEKMIPLSVVGH